MKNTLIAIITITLMAGSIFAGTNSELSNNNSMKDSHSEGMIYASNDISKKLNLTKEEQKLHKSIVKKMMKNNYCNVDHANTVKDIYPIDEETDLFNFRR